MVSFAGRTPVFTRLPRMSFHLKNAISATRVQHLVRLLLSLQYETHLTVGWIGVE
jgi:hypothetical protein